MNARRCNPLVVFSGIALLCGCSSFDRDWKVNSAEWRLAAHTDITGPWQGTWQSDASGHSGDLRCLITRTGDTTYHARFAATYWKLFHFGYEMDLTADPHLDQLHFEGQSDLGWLAGGKYQYDGHANSTDLYCTYQSSYDHGHFTMKRPEEP